MNQNPLSQKTLRILRGAMLAVLLGVSAWTITPSLPANAGGPLLLYVNCHAHGANTGTSWEDAYLGLQSALDAATGGGYYQVWVAACTYQPFRTFPVIDPADTFQLHNNTTVYGGFAGTETLLSQRNWVTNATILDGHKFIPLNNNYYAYHVVTGSGIDASAVLDGFTVTGGNAYGSMFDGWGGGMTNAGASPTVRNVIFSGNSATVNGGGMLNSNNSNPTLVNVTFISNSAETGGGMYNYSSSPHLVNVTFSGNSATSEGGGMENYASNPTLTNAVFSGNSADDGGGMYNRNSSLTFVNVTFSGNSATDGNGGAMVNESSNSTIVNSILWGNTASYNGPQIFDFSSSSTSVSYSDIQGGYMGDEVISSDPNFVRNPSPGTSDYGDVHLQPGSPVIDVGNDLAIPVGITTDREGNPRIMGKKVDMGAYEAFLRLFLPLIRK